jgi:predicted transposase YdaD
LVLIKSLPEALRPELTWPAHPALLDPAQAVRSGEPSTTQPEARAMAKPFDSTLKQLIDRYCADWSEFMCVLAGLPAGTRAQPLDADLGSISPEADKLFRVEPPGDGVVHVELQAGWSGDQPQKLHVYNTLAAYRYGGPVRSLLVLLRPEANARALTGVYTCADEAGEYLRFRYRVIRLWELPSGPLLEGPLGLLPLGLLTDDAQPHLGDLLRRVDARLEAANLSLNLHAEMLTACHILLGLRYDDNTVRELFRGLRTMRESSTYQAILAEGRGEGRIEGRNEGRVEGRVEGLVEGQAEGRLSALRVAVQDAGGVKLGPMPAEQASRLAGITDEDRLRRILRHIWNSPSWSALLDIP